MFRNPFPQILSDLLRIRARRQLDLGQLHASLRRGRNPRRVVPQHQCRRHRRDRRAHDLGQRVDRHARPPCRPHYKGQRARLGPQMDRPRQVPRQGTCKETAANNKHCSSGHATMVSAQFQKSCATLCEGDATVFRYRAENLRNRHGFNCPKDSSRT